MAAGVARGEPAVAARPAPPLKPQFTRGFVYSDGWVDDARLVVLNAIDAAAHGATVLTRCACTRARTRRRRLVGHAAARGRRAVTVSARALVNATGPWAAQFLATPQAGQPARNALRLVKGSHIVVQAHVRPRARLHLPEPRQAHHLRHSLRTATSR
jgi:glycerol-3-phosphate dehydrogenase